MRTDPVHQWAIVALGLSAACYREVPRTMSDTTPPATFSAPDTIVHRVARVTRVPWMIQRATGHVSARRAQEPLDSILALRVLDQRGAELPGVRVHWTAVNPAPGSRMRVIEAITDSLGLSRVEFVPGATASPQGMRAEVADVAGLDFLVRVPVADLRVVPQRAEVWSGETIVLGVELRDSAGTLLEGGAPAWKSSDTTVLVTAAADPPAGAARGRRAGQALAIASIDSARSSALVTVRPVLTARFITITGSAVPAMRLELRTEGLHQSVTPTPSGLFAAKLDVDLDSRVELRATASGDTSHHPVSLRTSRPRSLQDLTVALIPKSWRIDSGTYAGHIVAIDPARALDRPGSAAAFWRVSTRTGLPRVVGWRAGDFPLRIAFDHSRGADATATDSIAFWQAASQMQRDLGVTLFVPTTFSVGATGGGGVIPVEIGGPTAGHTSLTWSEGGDVYDGALRFEHVATLRDTHIVTHELLHLLGFGHTSSWRTVAAPSGGTEARLTIEDVAYAQLALRLRQLYEQFGAHPGLPIAP